MQRRKGPPPASNFRFLAQAASPKLPSKQPPLMRSSTQLLHNSSSKPRVSGWDVLGTQEAVHMGEVKVWPLEMAVVQSPLVAVHQASSSPRQWPPRMRVPTLSKPKVAWSAVEAKDMEGRLQGTSKATGASRTPLRVKNRSNRPWGALLSRKVSMRIRSNQATEREVR